MADCERILPYIQPGWIGVEIGVSRGDSSVAFFEHGVRFMYLIDPWEDYDGLLDKVTPGAYKEAMDKLSPYAGRHSHLRMQSAEAARYISAPVDFVFVDGNHRYEWVKKDLELYWPKIRPGGKLCGHDYTDNGDTCQVKRAVDEFYSYHGIGAMFQAFPDISSCWIIHKP